MSYLHKLKCQGFLEKENSIWLSNWFFNALIEVEKANGNIRTMKKFPDYEVWKDKLYSEICLVDGTLVFVPNKSEEVVSYHIENGRFTSCALDVGQVGEAKPYFKSAVVYRNYVYMFPMNAECIIRYDVVENSIKYFENLSHIIKNEKHENFIWFPMRYEILNGKVYIPFVELNAVAIFDINKESLDIRHIDIRGGCTTINYMQGHFYMASSRSPNIYRWDIKTDEVKIYDAFPEKFVPGQLLFSDTCRTKNRIVFFPLFSNMIVSLDIHTGEIHEERRIEIVDEGLCKTYCVRKSKGKVYVITSDQGNICIARDMDSIDRKIGLMPGIRWENRYNQSAIDEYLMNQGYFDGIFEKTEMLEEYLEILEKSKKRNILKPKGSNGKLIFDRMMDMVKP